MYNLIFKIKQWKLCCRCTHIPIIKYNIPITTLHNDDELSQSRQSKYCCQATKRRRRDASGYKYIWRLQNYRWDFLCRYYCVCCIGIYCLFVMCTTRISVCVIVFRRINVAIRDDYMVTFWHKKLCVCMKYHQRVYDNIFLCAHVRWRI